MIPGYGSLTTAEALIAAGAIAAAWTGLAILLVGAGLSLRRALGARSIDADGIQDSFWAGVCLAVVFLQVWNLWLPITGMCLAALAIAGTAGLLGNAGPLSRWVGSLRQGLRWPSILAMLAITGWLALESTGPIDRYSSASYHLSAVRWATEYPIVPGLGNLHGRLAFNNSTHLLAAMLEVGPGYGRSGHLLNGLLALMLFGRILVAARRLARPGTTAHHVWAFDLCLLLPAVYIALKGDLAGLRTDAPTTIVLLVAASTWYSLRVRPSRDVASRRFRYLVTLLLFALAICFKISALGFGVVAVILLIALRDRTPMDANASRSRRPVALGFVLLLLLLGPWVVRGLLLSGYPLYPSTLLSLPVDWRVPQEQAAAEMRWVRVFARFSSEVPDDARQVATDWRWLKPWTANLVRESWMTMLLPFGVIAATATAFLTVRRFRDRQRHPSLAPELPLLGASALALVGWFLSAPAPRFGLSAAWILAAVAVAFAVREGTGPTASPLLRRALLIGLLLLGMIPLDDRLVTGPEPRAAVEEPPGARPLSSPRPDLQVYETASHLRLFVPRLSDNCWDSPLPCTPHPAPNLRLREPVSLEGGFRVDGRWQPEHWPNRRSHFLEMWRASQHPAEHIARAKSGTGQR